MALRQAGRRKEIESDRQYERKSRRQKEIGSGRRYDNKTSRETERRRRDFKMTTRQSGRQEESQIDNVAIRKKQIRKTI